MDINGPRSSEGFRSIPHCKVSETQSSKIQHISINNENMSQRCNCKDIGEKLISVLKDNGNLVQIIRELRMVRESLKGELERPRAADASSRPGRTGADDNNSAVHSLIDINHGWKRDYEELQM